MHPRHSIHASSPGLPTRPQCWFRQYLARQVLYVKLAEADYINRMLHKKRWDQVGMVVVPNKYVRQYLR